jgi:hypothetical protein
MPNAKLHVKRSRTDKENSRYMLQSHTLNLLSFLMYELWGSEKKMEAAWFQWKSVTVFRTEHILADRTRPRQVAKQDTERKRFCGFLIRHSLTRPLQKTPPSRRTHSKHGYTDRPPANEGSVCVCVCVCVCVLQGDKQNRTNVNERRRVCVC